MLFRNLGVVCNQKTSSCALIPGHTCETNEKGVKQPAKGEFIN